MIPRPASRFCASEMEVLEAVAAGRLIPFRASPALGSSRSELQRHVEECAVCSDAALVAAALRDEQDAAWSDAGVPPAEVIWLRARIRARRKAMQLAARPVAVVQAFGFACAVGAGAALIGTVAWWLRSWVAWLSHAASVVASAPSSIDVASVAARGVLLALCVWLVIAPVAVYLAAADD